MIAWLLFGFLAGLINAFSIVCSVSHMRPGALPRAAWQTAGGFFFRLAVSALVLILALRTGAAPGLLAFAGLWLARWIVVISDFRFWILDL